VSLILDALRRADAERDRGAVPGLHAQQAASLPQTRRRPRRPRWAGLTLAAAAAVAAALAAWLMAGGASPQPGASAAAPPPAVAAEPPAPASAPASPPVAAAPPAPAPPRAAAVEPQPVAEPAPWPSPDGSRKAASVGVATVPAGHAGVAGPAAAGAPAAPAIVRREQLPEDIRAQLPPLVVGGSIYSPNGPDRTVIIDGRILREKDRLGADLTVERIGSKSAVLRFREHRFEIGF
jgi:general secretion pathway protein B